MPLRLAQMAALGRDSLLEVDGSALRFRTDRRTRERLAAFVAAESACCPFLDLHLTEQRDRLVLTITGPEPAEPMVTELLNAFRGAQFR
jgi:hypothetical protein